MQEILVILVLALIFLGPSKLPELASGIGKAIREVRKATADIKNEIQLDDAIRKPLEELREATMLPPEELKRRDEEKKWRAQREKEDAEARAREPAAIEAAPGHEEDYDESHYDGHEGDAHDDGHSALGDGHLAEDYQRDVDSDPNSHAPASHATVSADEARAISDAAAVLPDLTVRDMAPVSPASPLAGAPAPIAPPPTTTTARMPLPRPPTDDRTIAMPLPPPMEGSVIPTLPPPRAGYTPRTTPPSGGVGRAVPPPPPPDAMKPPTGAVARPTGTLFGVASPVVPAAGAPQVPGPPPGKEAVAAEQNPRPTTAPLGVKLPTPPVKKT